MCKSCVTYLQDMAISNTTRIQDCNGKQYIYGGWFITHAWLIYARRVFVRKSALLVSGFSALEYCVQIAPKRRRVNEMTTLSVKIYPGLLKILYILYIIYYTQA